MKDEDYGETVGFTCLDCRFFEKYEGERRDGECKRFPPVGALREEHSDEDEGGGAGAFAVTLAYEWCGEFELSPQKRTDWALHKATRSP